MTEHFDAIVIGSGFGGSVMTYRLAQAGMNVCLLERGKAYPPDSFAREPRHMPGAFWDPSEGLYGLFNIWSFTGQDVVVSSGLGGGSLVYGNVLLEKTPESFVRANPDDLDAEDWPLTHKCLKPHYAAVRAILEPQLFPDSYFARKDGRRARAFRDAMLRDDIDWRARRNEPNQKPKPEITPLAVTFANKGVPPEPHQPMPIDPDNYHGENTQRYTCVLCGECDVGCNYGSKNTLDHTFLSRIGREARAKHVSIRPRHEVRYLRPLDGGGYEVFYVEHTEENEGQRTNTSSLPVQRMTADQVVLSAGALGSTFLLLKSRHHFPHISRRLGAHFSGNGDTLAFAVRDVSGDRLAEPFDSYRGPVITGSYLVNYWREDGTLGEYHVQDAGYPEYAAWMLHILEIPGALWAARGQLAKAGLRHLLKRPETNLSAEAANLFRHYNLAQGLMPMLSIGRDTPDGQLFLNRQDDLDLKWRIKRSKEYYERANRTMARAAKGMNARFHASIHYKWRRAVTDHPLGGCSMGTSIERGVVDDHGEVFNYPGLFVADGAAMPGPVGANPSLTIAALSDHFADRVIANHNNKKNLIPKPVPLGREAIRMSCVEVMHGAVTEGAPNFETGLQMGLRRGEPLTASLRLLINDADAFFEGAPPVAGVGGYVEHRLFGGRVAITKGEFRFFENIGDSRHKRMSYRLFVSTRDGNPMTLIGIKTVTNDPGFDAWSDTTTMDTRIMRGQVDSDAENGAEEIARGVLKIGVIGVLQQLISFRTKGRSKPEQLWALLHFGWLYLKNLREVYG